MKHLIYGLLFYLITGCVTTGGYNFNSVEVENIYDKGMISYSTLKNENIGIVGMVGPASHDKLKFDGFLYDALSKSYGAPHVRSQYEVLKKLEISNLEYHREYREHSIDFDDVKKTDFSKLKNHTRYLVFFDVLNDKLSESDYKKDYGSSFKLCFVLERTITVSFHIYDTYELQPVWGGDFISSDDNKRCHHGSKAEKSKSKEEAVGNLISALFSVALFTASYEPVPTPNKADIMEKIFQKFILETLLTRLSKPVIAPPNSSSTDKVPDEV